MYHLDCGDGSADAAAVWSAPFVDLCLLPDKETQEHQSLERDETEPLILPLLLI